MCSLTERLYAHEHYQSSAKLARDISSTVPTFHHHFHIVLPLLEMASAKTYMEIGCYLGGSACTALQCESVQQFIGVDTFSVWPNQEQKFRENIARLCPRSTDIDVSLFRGSSYDPAIVSRVYRLLLCDASFSGIDVLFIDGDHCYDAVLADFRNYAPLVKPGGVIVFDDYDDYESSRAVRICVDDIVAQLSGDAACYRNEGQPENRAGAFGNGLGNVLSNEYVLSRKPLPLREGCTNGALFVTVFVASIRNESTWSDDIASFRKALNNQSVSHWIALIVGDGLTSAQESKLRAMNFDQSVVVNVPVRGEGDDDMALNYALFLCNCVAGVDRVYFVTGPHTEWDCNVFARLQEQAQMAEKCYIAGEFGVCWTPKTVPVRYCGADPYTQMKSQLAEIFKRVPS